MDKEAFLHQLEYAITNNDKELFIETIFDLPAEVIIGFTKEELSQAINLSSKIDLQSVEELFDFLENEGSLSLNNALEGVNELNNFSLCRFYNSLFISLSKNNLQKIKYALMNNALAYCKLAEMSIDSKENLEKAVSFYETARKIFSKTSEDYANALNNESLARVRLAEMGIDSKGNLEKVISLCEAAHEIFPKKSANYAISLNREALAREKLAEIGIDSRVNLEKAVILFGTEREILAKKSLDYFFSLNNESLARVRLAEMGIDSKENLEKAVSFCRAARKIIPKTNASSAGSLVNESLARLRLAEMGIDSKENLENTISLCEAAQEIFSKKSANYAGALVNESIARLRLADIGIDSRGNLEKVISLYEIARKIFPKKSADYADALMSEGNARVRLAEMGIDSKENLETAVSLCIAAQEIFPETSVGYALSLNNEGNARLRLAEMGIDSNENLETAVNLCRAAQEILPEMSTSYAGALNNEGNARFRLAEMGIDNRENLLKAVSLCKAAQEIFPEKSISYASSLNNEGSARLRLAEIGIDSEENLKTAVSLCRSCREIYSKKGKSHASALNNEGLARLRLAEMGIDSKENLEKAVSLCEAAQEIFPKTSINYALSLNNEGLARIRLADIGIDNKENFNKSKKLYLKCISVLEKLEDGWTYSIALLNFNILLKENFNKTGNKEYLEEWERNLGDIEEKIKNRKIRYKELLMARIHEIRASLFEFDGELGISNASLEYYKAYEISNEIFYKFMGEFCQARIVKPSIFCSLVSDWKEVEKEGIFLDYYDYTVFECHLENALKSTINEEEELKLAVEKLKEIRDRTQIKIIKDRVSAYIHLLQALVDCFNNYSYKEAAENVKEGCKIFHEYGDKQGQQMCEIFHNAIVRKNSDAWQEIIRNREFSSNFYSLLCEYSDRKRADLESHKLSQIYEVVNRTGEKVDQLQATLNQECDEIKDKIENGFDGTVSEFREIKVKINSIQEDFDHLIQVSNNVNGNEGEFIRKFVTQMLDLMKKGEPEIINRFLEEIIKSETSLEETLENNKIPEKEKAEAKSKLADLQKIPGIVKDKTKSFSVDVTKDVVVTLTSNEIIKLLTPVLSTAIFGVPIPSQVVEILLKAIRNS